jgi:hypothetical protein
MILHSGAASATCFDGPSFTTVAANNAQSSSGSSEHMMSGSSSQHVMSGSSAGTGSSQSSTSVMGLGGVGSGQIGPATESHLATSGEQPYTFVQGQLVPGVTGVTLTRSDGSDVQATVADGSFAAWWPGSSNATSAHVMSASGVTTQQLTFTTPPTGSCTPSLAAASCANGSGSAGGGEGGTGPQRPGAGK